jgi:phosphoribosylamine--glycine ligase
VKPLFSLLNAVPTSTTQLVLLGAGAREHALATKLRQDGATVHVLPGNAGIPGSVPSISATDFPAIQSFCQEHGIKLIVVGPEAPLAAGVADYFLETDIRVFGPRRQAATLESSKVWSKDFMRRHGIATARAWSYRSDQLAEAQAQAEELDGQVVVKYDGLAAGKGVYVCSSIAEATAALAELRELHEGWFSFLLEEKLTGPEVSLIGLTDGNRIRLLAPAQDHKQLLANDEGPNTGGMGAYCPVPFLDDNSLAAIRTDIIDPTLRGLQAEPFDFVGFLYFGVMLTPSGPKLLEYNVRLGDPEAEVILPALESSLLELIEATLDGNLAQTITRQRPGAFVGVVLASGGYPAAQFPTGFPIHGIGNQSQDTQVFVGGVKAGEQPGELLTNGGRVAVVVAHGPDLPTAIQLAYAETEKVYFQDKYVRPDIGQRPAPLLETSAY